MTMRNDTVFEYDNQPLAYLDRRVPRERRSAAAPHPRRISRAAAPVQGSRTSRTRSCSSGRRASTAASRAERALERLRERGGTRRATTRAALKRSRKAVEWSRYYEDARELARQLDEWSLSLDSPHHRFVVCSGGGPGIMEAANRGAHEAGGKTHRLEHPPAVRAGGQPLHHRRAALRVPLLLHAQVLVRVPRQGAGDLSGRVRHARRDVRDPDADADAEAGEADLRHSVRHASTGSRSSTSSRWWSGARSAQRISICCTAVDTPEEAFELLRTHLTDASPRAGRRRRRIAAPGIAKTRG